MSDDGFFREVDEELRSDKLKSFWDGFGLYIIGGVLLIVSATAAYGGWNWYKAGQASASGDRFLEALNQANAGNTDAALASLGALEADGFGQYPVLARMRAATLLADQGDLEQAVDAFDQIAADGSVPEGLRDVATIRAAYVMVDLGNYGEVANRAEPLTGPQNPMRHSAREALGLAAWKQGRKADARRLFDDIVADPFAPAGVAGRAQLMLELIQADGIPVEG